MTEIDLCFPIEEVRGAFFEVSDLGEDLGEVVFKFSLDEGGDIVGEVGNLGKGTDVR